MIKIIGALMVPACVVGYLWWLKTDQARLKLATPAFALGLLAAIALVVNDRITEFSIENIGALKAAKEQITADAKDVAEIKQRVESQSATIDLVAAEASKAKELAEELEEKNRAAEENLKRIDETLRKASEKLVTLESITEFQKTVVAAQNDDRKAFDQLHEWGDDESHIFCTRARQAWPSIQRDVGRSLIFTVSDVPWREGLDPSKLTIEDLRQVYKKEVQGHMRQRFLKYIHSRADIPKRDRMQFLADVIRNEQSLETVARAGKYFKEASGLNVHPLSPKEMLEWWEKNKDSLE